MTLLADRGKRIFHEQDVDVIQPSWSKTPDAYDLALYEEVGKGGTQAVLEVTMVLAFDFRDTGNTPALMWTAKDKTDFMANVKKEITDAWSEKYQIVTKNPTPPAKVAGVIFDVQTRDGGWRHSHWNVKCKKVASSYPSGTPPGGGKATWDSLDLTPEIPYGAKKQSLTIMQRGAVHEFGHMLGYRDEYPNDTPGTNDWLYNPLHLGDTDSVMYWGETIEPRHYVLFADWISLQWIKKDGANCKGHDWKVSGRVDMTNAQL